MSRRPALTRAAAARCGRASALLSLTARRCSSPQYLEEADQLADHVAILDAGRIVAHGTPLQLKQRIPGGHIELTFADPDARRTAADVLRTTVGGVDELTLQVPSDGNVATLRDVLGELDHAGVDVDSLSLHTPNLDDVFFALTGRLVAGEPIPDYEEAFR
jgi:ABC-2 type transport system ATP-binding protein